LARHAPDEAGAYQIAYGERRLRAAEIAGLPQIPVYVRDLTDQQMLEVAMAENILRADLNPLEEARGLQEMKNTFGLSIRDLAVRLGKGKGYVEKRLYLLNTPPEVQEMIAAHPETVRAARPLAAIDDAVLRARLIEEVVASRLTSDDIEERADQLLRGEDDASALSPTGDTDGRPPSRAERELSPTGDSLAPDDSTALYLKRDRLSIGYRALTGFFGTRRVTYDEDTASKVRAIRDLCDRYLGMWEARGEH
ncbi:MAG TPA: ParB/RepB/Spo0J family partition protein, partial [Chloroflexia bacterium]|nr:ParB/RepB/Spo0J family partition protein [Chloroflexia bacterium]